MVVILLLVIMSTTFNTSSNTIANTGTNVTFGAEVIYDILTEWTMHNSNILFDVKQKYRYQVDNNDDCMKVLNSLLHRMQGLQLAINTYNKKKYELAALESTDTTGQQQQKQQDKTTTVNDTLSKLKRDAVEAQYVTHDIESLKTKILQLSTDIQIEKDIRINEVEAHNLSKKRQQILSSQIEKLLKCMMGEYNKKMSLVTDCRKVKGHRQKLTMSFNSLEEKVKVQVKLMKQIREACSIYEQQLKLMDMKYTSIRSSMDALRAVQSQQIKTAERSQHRLRSTYLVESGSRMPLDYLPMISTATTTPTPNNNNQHDHHQHTSGYDFNDIEVSTHRKQLRNRPMTATCNTSTTSTNNTEANLDNLILKINLKQKKHANDSESRWQDTKALHKLLNSSF